MIVITNRVEEADGFLPPADSLIATMAKATTSTAITRTRMSLFCLTRMKKTAIILRHHRKKTNIIIPLHWTLQRHPRRRIINSSASPTAACIINSITSSILAPTPPIASATPSLNVGFANLLAVTRVNRLERRSKIISIPTAEECLSWESPSSPPG